jgi:oligoendopeptidase F
VTFEEGARLIQAALRPLGEEYAEIMARAFRDRWIDRADNPGKAEIPQTGWVYRVHPYVVTAWQDRMNDASVLAHELGHVGHLALASRHQVISNGVAGRFFVETPSSLNQLLLGYHLLDTTDDPRLRRWTLLQLLDSVFMTLMVLPTLLLGHLERRLYALAEADRPITPAAILELQGEVFERFFAGTVVVDEGARLTWMQWPQFYVEPPYWFTYVAGVCCACNIVEALRTEGEPAVARLLQALKAGGSLPPLELMRLAGVDMTGPEPLQRAVGLFGRLVDELERSCA